MAEHTGIDPDTVQPVPNSTPSPHDLPIEADPDTMMKDSDNTTERPDSKTYSQEEQHKYGSQMPTKKSSRFRNGFNQVTNRLLSRPYPSHHPSPQQGNISNASIAMSRGHSYDTRKAKLCTRCPQLEDSISRLSPLIQDCEDKRKQIERLKSKKGIFEGEIDDLKNDLDASDAHINDLKSQIARQTGEIKRLRSELIECKSKMEAFESEIIDRDIKIERQSKAANQEHNENKRHIESLSSEIATRDAKIRVLKQTISKAHAGNPDVVPDNKISSDYQYLISQLKNWAFSNFRRSKPTGTEEIITGFGLNPDKDTKIIAAASECLTGSLNEKCLAIGMLVMWYLQKHIFDSFIFGLDKGEDEFFDSLESSFAKTSTTKETSLWRSKTIHMVIATESHKKKVSDRKKEIVLKLKSALIDILPPPIPSDSNSWLENLGTIVTQAVELSLTLRVQRPIYFIFSPKPGDDFEDNIMEPAEDNMDDDSDDADSVVGDGGYPGGYPREKSLGSVRLSIFPSLFKDGNEEGEKYEQVTCIQKGKVIKA